MVNSVLTMGEVASLNHEVLDYSVEIRTFVGELFAVRSPPFLPCSILLVGSSTLQNKVVMFWGNLVSSHIHHRVESTAES